jgi:hypothetical protein
LKSVLRPASVPGGRASHGTANEPPVTEMP